MLSILSRCSELFVIESPPGEYRPAPAPQAVMAVKTHSLLIPAICLFIITITTTIYPSYPHFYNSWLKEAILTIFSKYVVALVLQSPYSFVHPRIGCPNWRLRRRKIVSISSLYHLTLSHIPTIEIVCSGEVLLKSSIHSLWQSALTIHT